MKRLRRAGLISVVSLVLASVVTAGTAASAAPHPDGPGAGKPSEKGGRYLYSASFTATVTNDLKLVHPGPNNDDIRHLSASIVGSHAGIQVSTGEEFELIPRSRKSSVTVTSATLSTTARTDDGRYVDTCTGSSAKATGPASPLPGLLGFDYLTFTTLEFPASCTDTEGQASTARYFLPGEKASLVSHAGEAGDKVITYPLKTEWGTAPMSGASSCPGWVVGPDNTCSYTISGTLTLKLIKELKPSKGQSKNASVTEGAKKAAVEVQCPMACRMEIEVMPLRGSPRVLTRENLSLQPDKNKTVSLPIPPMNRAPAVKSGGVRIRITYRIPGMPPFAETRSALL